jgi:hypothetical protein
MVESLGLRISKSEVSRICQGLDEQLVDCLPHACSRGRLPGAGRQGGEGPRRRRLVRRALQVEFSGFLDLRAWSPLPDKAETIGVHVRDSLSFSPSQPSVRASQ